MLLIEFFSSRLFYFFHFMNANGRRCETLGSSELLNYQGTTNLDTRTEVRITTSPPMFYDRMLNKSSFVGSLGKFLT